MQGLCKLTAVANNIEARRDWQALAGFAAGNGYSEQAAKLTPPDNAGWRKIDQQIGKLRRILVEAGLDVPSNPSAGGAE